METQITKVEEKKSNLDIDLIKRTVAKDTTDDELKLFLYTCQRTGLDPLTRQIHCIKRGGQMAIQTGIDGYRVIAERSGALAGIEDAVYDDETKPFPGKATVTVWKIVNGQRVSFTSSARWAEYKSVGPMWTKMPYLMLAKCAEALALRKAFPNDLSGIYTNEEMQQADNQVVATEHVPTAAVRANNETPIVSPAPIRTGRPCDTCGNPHNGQYPTCYNCYNAKRNGTAIQKAAKTFDGEIVDDAPPIDPNQLPF